MSATMDETSIIIPDIGASPAPICVESSAQMSSSTNYVSAQNRRKEKARIAARARRSQEASIIMEMANELHITQEKFKRIDKATIVKLAIDYIKAFDILCRFRCNCCNGNNSNSIIDHATTVTANYTDDTNNQTISDITTTANIPATTNEDNEDHDDENQARIVTNDENIPTNNAIHQQQRRQATNFSAIVSDCNEHREIITHLKRNRSNSIIIPSSNKHMTRDKMVAARQIDEKSLRGMIDLEQPPMPKLSTTSIFAPKTDEMDSHFLMINERDGTQSFVLKPDSEILDEDDLTHLAPQAGDISISLDVEPLDGIVLDTGLFASESPPPKKAPIGSLMAQKMLQSNCYIGTVD